MDIYAGRRSIDFERLRRTATAMIGRRSDILQEVQRAVAVAVSPKGAHCLCSETMSLLENAQVKLHAQVAEQAECIAAINVRSYDFLTPGTPI